MYTYSLENTVLPLLPPPITNNLRYFIGLGVQRGRSMVTNLQLVTNSHEARYKFLDGEFVPIWESKRIQGGLCGIGTANVIL